MPPADHARPAGPGRTAADPQPKNKNQNKSKKKKFDPDAEISGALGCLTPAFFAHVLGTALVLSPLSWGGAGAVLSGLGAFVVFIATVGADFNKFKAGTNAHAKARRLAWFLIWYGLATFAASLAVVCVRESEGAVWNSIFCVALPFGGLLVRGTLLGAKRAVAPAPAGVLTLVIPLLLVLDAVAFMSYPGVSMAAVVLSLSAIAFLIVCMACNGFRTPVVLNAVLVGVLLLFLPTSNHQRSASALWLSFTGEKQTCRLLANPPERRYSFGDGYDYYHCPGEVLRVDRRGVFASTTSADEVMVRDGTRWTTAFLRPGDVKMSTATVWLVHFGAILVLLGAVLVIALFRRERLTGD
ncbi:hypothetical protein ACQP1W_06055 [Spirillospora sp. CA-255316]